MCSRYGLWFLCIRLGHSFRPIVQVGFCVHPFFRVTSVAVEPVHGQYVATARSGSCRPCCRIRTRLSVEAVPRLVVIPDSQSRRGVSCYRVIRGVDRIRPLSRRWQGVLVASPTFWIELSVAPRFCPVGVDGARPPTVWHSVDRVDPSRVFTVIWFRHRARFLTKLGAGCCFHKSSVFVDGKHVTLCQSVVTVVSSLTGTALRHTAQTYPPSTHSPLLVPCLSVSHTVCYVTF